MRKFLLLTTLARAGYRGKRLCWNETDSSRGYGHYAPRSNLFYLIGKETDQCTDMVTAGE